jgi:hypothetical protein
MRVQQTFATVQSKMEPIRMNCACWKGVRSHVTAAITCDDYEWIGHIFVKRYQQKMVGSKLYATHNGKATSFGDKLAFAQYTVGLIQRWWQFCRRFAAYKRHWDGEAA